VTDDRAKWECFLTDGFSPVDVLLCQAWGPRIDKAKATLKENQTYQIENYVIHKNAKGKSFPFGKNTIKLIFTEQLRIKAVRNDTDLSILPKELPTSDLDDFTDLRSIQIISLVLKVDKAAPKKYQIIPRTGKHKLVTNVMMKAKKKLIQFSAWGKCADIMHNKTGILRLDAVSITPIFGDAKMKISTRECSSIKNATAEETAKFQSQQPDDSEEDSENEHEEPNDHVDVFGEGGSWETLRTCLHSDVDDFMNLLSQAAEYFNLSRKRVRRYFLHSPWQFSAETEASILEALAEHHYHNDAASLHALHFVLPQALFSTPSS